MTESIDALLRAYDGAVPGAAVLVARDAEPVARLVYGLADLERATPVTPATNFRLASITKQFTAAAILLLAQEKLLGLDNRARNWLPTLPPAADAVTIRQLLTHGAGLVDYEDLIPPSTQRQLADADVLTLLEGENRTYFAPGSSYRYSNGGYALLALIVERASGRAFADFLRERLFGPLGMLGTVAYRKGIDEIGRRHLATARTRNAGFGRIKASPAPSSATAASILRSTTWRSGMPRFTTTGYSPPPRCDGCSPRRLRPTIPRSGTASAGASPAIATGTPARRSDSGTSSSASPTAA
jgi:CubicO group peptidase (beta-lactamase class C family)